MNFMNFSRHQKQHLHKHSIAWKNTQLANWEEYAWTDYV